MRKLVFMLVSLVLLSGFVTAGNEPNWPDNGRGDYINLKMGGGDLNQIFQFHFTDDPRHEKFGVDQDFSRRSGDPYIFASSNDKIIDGQTVTDDWGVYVAKKGEIIEGITGNDLDQYINHNPGDGNGCMSSGIDSNLAFDLDTQICTGRVDDVVDRNFDGGDSIKNRCGDDDKNNWKSCTLNYNTGDNGNDDGWVNNDGDKDENQDIYQAYTLFGQSEIIVAAPGGAINRQNPEDHSGGNEYHEYDFFLCDSSDSYNDGGPLKTGRAVYAPDPGTSSGELRGWQCTVDGDWEKLPECYDGISNYDDDGKVDATGSQYRDGSTPDTECQYGDTETSSPQQECVPKVLKPDGEDEKYAYYDSGDGSHNPLDADCNYKRESASDGLQTGTPITATCDKSSEPATLSTGPIDKLTNYCRSEIFKDDTNVFPQNSEKVEVVKYYVPEEAIPVSNSNPYEDRSDFVKNSDVSPPEGYRQCAQPSEEGFINTRCESLHLAENDYISGTEWHEPATWEDKNMTGLQGYENDNPDNYDNAWITANAAAQNNNKVDSRVEEITEPGVFNGGFAGKCPTGKRWDYKTDEAIWECSGALDWSPEYYVPDLPSQTPWTKKTGVFINQSVFFDDTSAIAGDNYPEQSFAGAWSEANEQNIATIEEVRYDCYPGDPGSSSPDWKIWSVPDSVNSNVFLPDIVDIYGTTEYACDFEINVQKSDGSMTGFESGLGNTAGEIQSADKAREVLGLGDYLNPDVGFTTFSTNKVQTVTDLAGPSYPSDDQQQ